VKHLEEDDLVLHYYREGEASAASHLEECAGCRGRFEALSTELGRIADDVAEPDAGYEARLWGRIGPALNVGQRRSSRPGWRRVALPASFAAAIAMAFLLGRQTRAPAPEDVRDRILLVAVGDHLERSEVLLLEILNADGPEAPADAEELLAENRLYRQAALRAGGDGVASVLDELERVLVEAAAAPEPGTGLEELRSRIESRGLVLRVRRVGQHLRDEGRARPGQGEES
jgi:hypothetical protein